MHFHPVLGQPHHALLSHLWDNLIMHFCPIFGTTKFSPFNRNLSYSLKKMPECLHMCKKCSTFADDFVVCVLPRSVTALNREGCANQPLSRSRESYITEFQFFTTTVTSVMGR